MDGRGTQIHEVWAFGYDGITREVQTTAQVDVDDVVVGDFLYNYRTESGYRLPILGQFSINGSVEYLDIPDFHRTGGPFWADNLLAPCSGWEDGGTSTNQNWRVQPGVPYGSVAVPWSRTVPALPAYVPRIPENARAAAHRVRDNHLQIRRLACMCSPATSRNHIRNPRVDRRDDHWEGPVDQYFLWIIYVGSVIISGFSFCH